jgi:outer membrane protein TolC
VRLGLVLLTVPLAAIGVIPGLVFFQEPFGFTSLLGTISLIGIVVNNAIILIDTIETKRGHMALEEAIPASVLERMRPILLTVLTTVSGLSPLLFSSSSLWPPFASAMISGLLASTVMTLLVVPAAYYLIYRRRGGTDAEQQGTDGRGRSGRSAHGPASAPTAVVLFALPVALLTLAAPPAGAQELSLRDALEGSGASPRVLQAHAELRAEEYGLRATRREAWLPALSLDGSYLRREEEVTTSFGPIIGDVTQLPEDEQTLSVTLEQPILDLARQEADVAAQRFRAGRRSAELQQERNRAALEVLIAYIEVRRVVARLEAARESRDALEAQLERVRRLVEGGRLLRSDLLRLEVELRSLEQRINELDRARGIRLMDLARRSGRAPSEVGSTVALSPEPAAVKRWVETAPGSISGRGEVRALASTIESLEARKRAVEQDALPEVRLRLSGVRRFDTALEPEQWLEGELTVSWTPFARGVRLARRREIAARRRALEAQYEDALEGGSVQLAGTRNDILSALERAQVAERNVTQEEQLLEETEELYRAGRRPLSDYVEAEARLQRARVNQRIALFDALHAAGRLAYLTGLPVVQELRRWNAGGG